MVSLASDPQVKSTLKWGQLPEYEMSDWIWDHLQRPDSFLPFVLLLLWTVTHRRQYCYYFVSTYLFTYTLIFTLAVVFFAFSEFLTGIVFLLSERNPLRTFNASLLITCIFQFLWSKTLSKLHKKIKDNINGNAQTLGITFSLDYYLKTQKTLNTQNVLFSCFPINPFPWQSNSLFWFLPPEVNFAWFRIVGNHTLYIFLCPVT